MAALSPSHPLRPKSALTDHGWWWQVRRTLWGMRACVPGSASLWPSTRTRMTSAAPWRKRSRASSGSAHPKVSVAFCNNPTLAHRWAMHCTTSYARCVL